MKHTGRVFYRYFGSLFALVVILIMSLWLINLHFISDNYSREIAQTVNRNLAQATSALDTHVRQMVNICYLVQNDSLFQKMDQNSQVNEMRQASAAISRYSAVLSLAETIFCYCPKQERVYLPSESLNLQVFMEQYHYANHDVQDLKDTLAASSSICIWENDSVTLPGRKTENVVTFFFSVPTHPIAERIHMGFLIRKDNIADLLTPITAYAGASVMLLDQKGNTVAFFGAEPDAGTAELMQSWMSEDADPGQTVKAGGSTSYLYRERSSSTGLTMVSMIPRASLEINLQRERLLITAGMAVILLAGGAAAFFLSRMHYRPIAHLVKKAVPEQALTHRVNELDAVAYEIERLNTQHKTLHERLKKQASAQMHVFCGKLLHGWDSDEELLHAAQDVGVSLSSPVIQVAAVYFHCKSAALPSSEQVRKVLSLFSPADQPPLVYGSESDSHRVTFIILSSAEETADTYFVPLRNALQSAFSMDTALGVSTVRRDYHDIPQAYREACIALDMRMVRGSNSISMYDEADFTDDILQYYPTRELERLQHQILQLKSDEAAQAIDDIIRLMREEHMSVTAVRIVCYDIINTIVRSFSALSSDKGLQISSIATEELISFTSMEELTDMLKRLTADTCASIRKLQEKTQDQRILSIVQYIQSNYASPAFSIDLLADHFGLSVSNLSHYFKSNLGKTLSDYVLDLRFTESCRLLRETDKTVREICADVGMLNDSSFIRRFKQLYGVTPGAYRDSCRVKESVSRKNDGA